MLHEGSGAPFPIKKMKFALQILQGFAYSDWGLQASLLVENQDV